MGYESEGEGIFRRRCERVDDDLAGIVRPRIRNPEAPGFLHRELNWRHRLIAPKQVLQRDIAVANVCFRETFGRHRWLLKTFDSHDAQGGNGDIVVKARESRRRGERNAPREKRKQEQSQHWHHPCTIPATNNHLAQMLEILEARLSQSEIDHA